MFISKKTIAILLPLFMASVFLTLAVPVFAQEGIVQCGRGTGAPCSICDIPPTLNRLMSYVIRNFVTPAAILMVMAGGFMILTAGAAPQQVETGKKILTNTLIGVLVISFSWLIVNTILVVVSGEQGGVGGFQGIGKFLPWNELNGDCGLGDVATTGGFVSSGGLTNGTTPPPSQPPSSPPPFTPPRPAWAPERKLIGNHIVECPTVDQCFCDGTACAVFPSAIVPLKQPSPGSQACAGQANGYCYISPETESRLKNLQIGLINSGAGEQLQVTEAWPPTRIHLNTCHQAATCVDMNFRPGQAASASKITNVINQADASGSRAVYEVPSQAAKDTLIRQGVPAGNIQCVSSVDASCARGTITGPHFSIYKK